MAKRNISGLKRGGPGRPKGIPNKVSLEVRTLAHQLLDDQYRARLQKALHSRKGLAPAVESMLWHYAYGKPRETVTVETDVPIHFTIDVSRAHVTDAPNGE